MTIALTLGLILQGLGIVVVMAVFRGSAWTRAGTYFLVAIFAFDGGAELLRLATGTTISQRSADVANYVGDWNIVVGFASVAYAIGYTAVAGRHRGKIVVDPATVQRVIHTLDWRLLAVFTVPLVVIAGGGGYSNSYAADAVVASRASSGLVGQFLVLGVTLTGIAFIARHPRRFLPAYLIQLAAVVLTGARLDVITVGVVTLVGLAVLGRRPKTRLVITALVVVGLLAASVDSSRSHYGRDVYQSASSIPARIGIIAAGFGDIVTGKPAAYPTESQPIPQRIDGNTFPASILEAIENKYQPVGLTTAANDVQLAVPSVLDPAKLTTDPSQRVEKLYEDEHFSLGYQSDFIPTQLGAAVGYFGPDWLPVLALLLGLAYGAAERRASKGLGFGGYLATLGLAICALSYEESNEIYPLTARGVLVVYIALATFAYLRRQPGARSGSRPRSAAASRPPAKQGSSR